MRLIYLPLQVLLFAVMTYAYLYPGSEALFNGRTDIVMSDDTDPAPLTYQYANVLKVWNENPSHLFYGAVYYPGQDPERGVAYWEPWSERWLVIWWSKFFPLEQLSTALVFSLMILNALAMYALARFLKWDRSIACGLALAWAFCAFTRARAKVHGAMAGTFHLPLIFLGLLLAARGKGKRSCAAAALCFLFAATAASYFVVTALFLAPFFLAFFALQPEVRANRKSAAIRLALALVPTLIFLSFSFLRPIPDGQRMTPAQAFPQTGETNSFLYYYSANPIDYLGSDISLNGRAEDPNPLKQSVNRKILDDLKPPANAHEHSNGIRWSLLIFVLIALIFTAMGKFRNDRYTHESIIYFFAFAAFSFWLSLSPDSPCEHCGPSYWLQSWVQQIRVPSRAGIGVHFAAIMITGLLLATPWRWTRIFKFPGLFPALMIASYPPLLQDMPIAAIRPAFHELQREQGPCGAGMYFPFVSSERGSDVLYTLLQKLRGSDCGILNAMTNSKRVDYLTFMFPPNRTYLNQLSGDQRTRMLILKFARCVPLTWIIFDPAVPSEWREDICRQLGWQLNPSLTCIAPQKGESLRRYPDECF